MKLFRVIALCMFLLVVSVNAESCHAVSPGIDGGVVFNFWRLVFWFRASCHPCAVKEKRYGRWVCYIGLYCLPVESHQYGIHGNPVCIIQQPDDAASKIHRWLLRLGS